MCVCVVAVLHGVDVWNLSIVQLCWHRRCGADLCAPCAHTWTRVSWCALCSCLVPSGLGRVRLGAMQKLPLQSILIHQRTDFLCGEGGECAPPAVVVWARLLIPTVRAPCGLHDRPLMLRCVPACPTARLSAALFILSRLKPCVWAAREPAHTRPARLLLLTWPGAVSFQYVEALVACKVSAE